MRAISLSGKASRGQTRRFDALRVSHRDARTLYAIVDCKDSPHVFIYYFSVQKYKKKLIQLKNSE